ncbi:MAG: carboxypeptidase-like regulatory domain-containing protein [Bacteroidetes bacterium]|nr:carboxypeptidase-like regulatory domain-containing protein [Bacteroidota bacterium]
MYKSKSKFVLLLALFCSKLFSQSITGIVIDEKNNDTLVGAIVQIDGGKVLNADLKGSFTFKLSEGKHNIMCKMIGYDIYNNSFHLTAGETKFLKINLKGDNSALDEVVVSAGKHEQKLSEVTVSMEVIKPSLVENKNFTSGDALMNQVPGVTVSDGQPSIRGGSGFTYGAGSRVLMLVDDMPMITADAGDIKWNFYPSKI